MTDNIPKIWGFYYQLSDAVKNITVDIHVQPGSGDIAFPRSSTVSVSSDPVNAADETDDQNSSPLTTLLGTLAEEGRIKARKNNRFKLALTGLDRIEWLTESQKLENQAWNAKKIANQWNNIFNKDTFALASFKGDKGSKIAFFEIAAMRPGKRSESLIMTIQGLRPVDQDLLTGMNQKAVKDISLTIGDSIPTTKSLLASHTDTEIEIESSPSKRSMANNDETMTTLDQDYSPLIGANDLVHSSDCLI